MDRETKKIKLDFCELVLKTYLTWGENEKIEGILLKGAKGINSTGVSDFDATILTEQKYVLLETVIVEITQKENSIGFKREWFDNLRLEEGNEIIKVVNETLSKSKKK